MLIFITESRKENILASDKIYTDKNQLQNLLLVTIDSSFDTQIDTWISAAEERVDGYLGYGTTASGLWNESIVNETNEARVDGDLNLVIYPRKRPINSVSQIELIKGSQSLALDLTTSTGTNRYLIPVQNNYIIYPNREISVTAQSTLIRNFADIKYQRVYTRIDYIAGYTTIPKDIQLATTLLTADTFMRQSNKEGLISITQGRVSKRWADRMDGRSDFEIQAFDILSDYRIASGWV